MGDLATSTTPDGVDLSARLVDYLIEDHRRLASRDVARAAAEDYEATIAQLEATMQGWQKIDEEKAGESERIINALTDQCQTLNTEIAELNRKNQQQADRIIELQHTLDTSTVDDTELHVLRAEAEQLQSEKKQLESELQAAQSTVPAQAARQVEIAWEFFDEDPEKALKAIERARLALWGEGNDD